MLNIISIQARDIPDAWFQCVYKILDYGHTYVIDRGSCQGQERLEFDYVTVQIQYPGVQPLFRIFRGPGNSHPCGGRICGRIPALSDDFRQTTQRGLYLRTVSGSLITEVIRMYKKTVMAPIRPI
jgi:thymidylate synthase